jgi:hypothetical protein
VAGLSSTFSKEDYVLDLIWSVLIVEVTLLCLSRSRFAELPLLERKLLSDLRLLLLGELTNHIDRISWKLRSRFDAAANFSGKKQGQNKGLHLLVTCPLHFLSVCLSRIPRTCAS